MFPTPPHLMSAVLTTILASSPVSTEEGPLLDGQTPRGIEARPVDPCPPRDTAPLSFVGRHPLSPGDTLWIAHGGLTWTLTVSAEAPWALDLGDHPHRMQTLHTWAHAAEGHGDPVLRCAGDLDGDAVLDLVVDLPDGRGRSVTTRFLSTQATGEQHVGPPAPFAVDPDRRDEPMARTGTCAFAPSR